MIRVNYAGYFGDKRIESRGSSMEEKESYKWIEASNQSKKKLAEANLAVIIQDREGVSLSSFFKYRMNVLVC